MGSRWEHAWLVRRFAPTLAAMVVVLVARSRPASAALCARWNDPATVSADSTASISFRTFAPIATRDGGYRLEPFAFDYPFRVSAISPEGRSESVRVAPSSEDSLTWQGAFVPDQPGTWGLVIENLRGSETKCYEDASLRVVAVTQQSETSSVVTIGLAGFFIALVAAVAIVAVFIGRRRATRA
jgi:hypothetical protein